MLDWNELSDLIKTRRSIRKFQDRPVPEDLLIKALELATWAPNGGNFQPWRFVIISNKELIHKMADAVKAMRDAVDLPVTVKHRIGIDRVEDYDLGTSLSLLAGVSPAALGASADEGVVRARAEGGLSTPFGFGWAQLGLQSRLRRDAREMVRRVQARWVAPTGHGHHLVVALDATGARRPARDAQLVAGGLNGLRAYPVQALAGTEMLRVNAEQRWLLGRDVARAVRAVLRRAARGERIGCEPKHSTTGGRGGLPRSGSAPRRRRRGGSALVAVVARYFGRVAA